MSASKKVYPSAVLKNLPREKQQAIVAYCDGEPDRGEMPHSLAATVAWLRADGITTSSAALSEFRSWFLLRRQLEENEMAAREIMQEGREQGWIKTEEEAQLAGQAFFTRLAMQQRDNLGFVRILREKTRQKQFQIQERRLKLLEDREAKTKAVLSDSTLTPEEKEARYKEILGMQT